MECEEKINIPNLFTPNNDGINDVFSISGIIPGKWSLEIYNRWGKSVYKSLNYTNDWNGENYPDGVYFYYIRDPERKKSFNGWLQILR